MDDDRRQIKLAFDNGRQLEQRLIIKSLRRWAFNSVTPLQRNTCLLLAQMIEDEVHKRSPKAVLTKEDAKSVNEVIDLLRKKAASAPRSLSIILSEAAEVVNTLKDHMP